MTVAIRPASPDDLAFAVSALGASGLPVDDLTADHLAFAAEIDGQVQGVIGIEVFGGCALLRSLVVSEAARGQGLGPALVTALEGSGKADGITDLWLLTIDADPFFSRLGYLVRQRGDAPAAIRNTREFSGLCPDDAVLMSKALD